MTGRLLTAEQVAEVLGVSPRYVWRLGREGELPRVKIGAHVRFDAGDVEAFIAECKEGPRPSPVHVEPARPRVGSRPRQRARRRL